LESNTWLLGGRLAREGEEEESLFKADAVNEEEEEEEEEKENAQSCH